MIAPVILRMVVDVITCNRFLFPSLAAGICASGEYFCAGSGCVAFAYMCDGFDDCVHNGTALDESEFLCGGKH